MSSKKVEQVADLQHSAAIRLLRYVRRDDTASGITGAQLSVLSVLFYGGPQTPSALAAIEQVRPPTMTQLLSALERLGLIKRTPLNGRSSAVTITDRGRDLFEAGRRRRLARERKNIGHGRPPELGKKMSSVYPTRQTDRLTDACPEHVSQPLCR